MSSKTTPNKTKSLLFWFVVVICFIGIPSTILLWAGSEYLSIQEKKAQTSFNINLQKIVIQAKKYIHAEAFWCKYFATNIAPKNRSKSVHELLKWLTKDKQNHPNHYDYIVWEPQGHIATQSITFNNSPQIWKEMLTALLPYAKRQNKAQYFTSIRKVPLNLRILSTLLGKQFKLQMIYRQFHPHGKTLLHCNTSGHESAFWFSFTQNYLAVVFIKPKYFQDNPGINNFLKQKMEEKKHINLGMYLPYNKQPIHSARLNNKKRSPLLRRLLMMDRNVLNFTKSNEFYTGLAFLNPEIRVFAQMKNPYSSKIKIYYLFIETLIIFLLLLPIFIYTFKTIVMHHPETLSIRWKMALLFLFANGLPLLAMFALSQRYYNQKRLEVVKKMYKKSISMLKNFDNKLLSTHAKYEENLRSFCNTWTNNLEPNVITQKQYLQLARKVKNIHARNFFLIASQYNCVVTETGIDLTDYSNKLEKLSGSDSISGPKKDKALMSAIGNYLMNSLNGKELPSSSMLKIGLFAESVLQKSLRAITHSFVKSVDNISTWELKKSHSLSFLKFISIPNSSIIDYLLIIVWTTERIEDVVIQSSILSANRNSLHLKILARKISKKRIYPKNFQTSTELHKFFDLVSNRPNDEIETISYQGEEYLCTGFKGNKLTSYQLAGLYPMKEIDRVISKQQKDTLLLMIFSVLLASGLAQLLSKSFNSPLKQIENTALAIERRDFSHQIRTIAKDEFGEIINIFNNAMVGLEELQVAKVVQDSLFPASDLTSVNFKTYGKVISKSDLGGTHFDYFDIDTEHFGIFFAKVLDKGVSAALIMAMAKAGLISSQNVLLDPYELTKRIYSLVHNTKHGKTTELIQLQYVCINKNNGRFTYANINMEAPIIMKKNKKWEFLKDDCPEYRLFDNDIIVFYTDCFKSNIDNEKNLPNLIISSDSSNVKVLCENIIDKHLSTNKNVTNLEDICIVASSFSPSQDITIIKDSN